jgi:hypothetical protein
MAEPENHTLRVSIEFRNEFKEFKAEAATNFARITVMSAWTVSPRPWQERRCLAGTLPPMCIDD